MIFLYNIFRILYRAGIFIAAHWNNKAAKWQLGRKNWEAALLLSWKPTPGNPVVWMHCASLGEFEQGRPLIEAIKNLYPHTQFLLTFFSPSGYEIRKNYSGVNYVMYLPFDSASNAKKLLNIIRPQLAVFIKYEFWHYYLQELKARKIDTILVSGIFRSTQPFFKWYGAFHRNILHCFTHLFVQDEHSKKLLTSILPVDKITIAGDTRFDRVLAAAQEWKPNEVIAAFTGGKKIIVAGSTWKEDEDLLAAWFSSNKNEWQLIIAPHETNDETIQRLQKQFSNSLLFTQLPVHINVSIPPESIIINTIGHLSYIYPYATICYVGGGFNKSGHHNILEAAVYGKAVITGPNFQKFKESTDLKRLGGSFAVNNSTELAQILGIINIEMAGKKAGDYVQENAGAINIILRWLQEKRRLTSA